MGLRRAATSAPFAAESVLVSGAYPRRPHLPCGRASPQGQPPTPSVFHRRLGSTQGKLPPPGRQSSLFGSAQCIPSHSGRNGQECHRTCISQLFQKKRVCRTGLGVRLSSLPPQRRNSNGAEGQAKHELPTHEKDPLSAEIIAGPMSHSQTGLAEARNLLSRVHGLALERSIRSLVGSTRYTVPQAGPPSIPGGDPASHASGAPSPPSTPTGGWKATLCVFRNTGMYRGRRLSFPGGAPASQGTHTLPASPLLRMKTSLFQEKDPTLPSVRQANELRPPETQGGPSISSPKASDIGAAT